jgi:hypothetical protein
MENTLVLNPEFGFDELDYQEMLFVNGGGVLNVIKGIGQIVVGVVVVAAGVVACGSGAAMFAVPEPTTLTKVGGVALMIAGVAAVAAGGTQVANGFKTLFG